MLKYTNILLLIETKLLEGTFLISVFDKWLYRFDRNKHGGRALVYIQDTIPSKTLEKHSCPINTEFHFIELNLKCKWPLCEMYHLLSQNDEYYLIILIRPLTLQQQQKDFACWGFQHRNNRTLPRICPLRTRIK